MYNVRRIMGRVHEKNPRYRTKAVIVRDVTFILNAPLAQGTKWAVLRDVAWVWTEFHGKYRGCLYWTKKARLREQAYPGADLRHEHAVPKNIVIKMLLDLPTPTTEQLVGEICEKFLIGVVVTPEEDAKLNTNYRRTMPEDFDDPASPHHQNWRLRYEMCNIEIECEK